MRSETPKDRAPSSVPNSAEHAHDDRERGASMAMDLLDTPGGDGSSDGLGFDNGVDGGTMLLPHERKLPITEQRRIIAARKHHDDGIDEDDSLAMGGRRGRGRRRAQADAAQAHDHRHGLHRHGPDPRHADGRRDGDDARARADSDADAGKASGGGSARGPVEKNEDTGASGSSGGGGTRVERDSQTPLDPTIERPVSVSAAHEARRLDDPAHPHAALYGAALKAVAELAPAQSTMGPAEQANVAAALTARIAGDPAFAQHVGDPSQLSFGLGQNGERVFAINHPLPEAPNATHVSVDLEQARALSIEASSHQVDIAVAARDPVQAQAIEAQIIEAHAREHAPRQA